MIISAHHARTALLAALTALSAACSTGMKPAGEPRPVPEGRPGGDGICGVPQPVGLKCSVLWIQFESRHDVACPEPRIDYGPGEFESPGAAPVLALLAADMARIPTLTDVEIVLGFGTGDTIRIMDRRFNRLVAALNALGIARDRFSRAYQPSEHAGYAKFESYGCAKVKSSSP